MIELVSTYGFALIKGVAITIFTWLIASILSISLGAFCGVFSSDRMSTQVSRMVIRIYTFIAKGIPAYVQILIAYFVIPYALGINIPGMISVIGALVFCSGGYVTEIVRSGINTIAHGQWEACAVLGYGIYPTLVRVIGPQVVRIILTQLGGELEQLLKSTSLLATVGISEITRVGMNIVSRELNPLPIYTLIAFFYLVITIIFQGFIYFLEKKYGDAYAVR